MTRKRRPAASQIDLFPVSAHFRRIRPEKNEWRFYSLSIQPELFGGAVLVRQWEQITSLFATWESLPAYREGVIRPK